LNFEYEVFASVSHGFIPAPQHQKIRPQIETPEDNRKIGNDIRIAIFISTPHPPNTPLPLHSHIHHEDMISEAL
jgi:hypothetical protein